MTAPPTSGPGPPPARSVMFIVVSARDLAAADALFEQLSSQSMSGRPAVPDLVSIGRKTSGDVRFHREPSLADAGRSWSGAAGLAAALFPSVGADLPSDRTVERSVLAVVSGRVASAVGRADLSAFGMHLDHAWAAVIAMVPAADADVVMAALPGDALALTCACELDVEDLDRLTARTRSSTRR